MMVQGQLLVSLSLQTSGSENLPLNESWFIGMLIISVLAIIVIAIGAGYWVFKDAAARDTSGLIWSVVTAVTFLFPPAGIVVLLTYLLIRGGRDKQTDQPAGTSR